MSLQEIRNRIDIKDAEILELLQERMALALMSRKFKVNIEDSLRETQLIEKIQSIAGTLIGPDFCEKLYRLIITESKKLQKEGHKIIGFQGARGANNEVAANAWNKEYISTACKTVVDVFDGVENGLYDYGIVPIENTIGGVVNQTNNLLLRSNLYVVGAVELKIDHCLLALPGTDHREIRVVYSHQRALDQCRDYLHRHKLDSLPFYSTAGAAKMLMTEQPKATAVIANRKAAAIYNLEIVQDNIQDLENNRTRFLILAKEAHSEGGEKCSIHFTTANESGSVFKVLQVFAEEKINLTRLESIPDKPGTYGFMLDFEGDVNDPKTKSVLEQVEKSTGDFRFMGCYRELHGAE